MMMARVVQWYSRAWDTFLHYPIQSILVGVILAVVAEIDHFGRYVQFFDFVVVGPVLSVGLCAFCLKLIRKNHPRFSDLLPRFVSLTKIWLAYCYWGFAILGGTIAAAIPLMIANFETDPHWILHHPRAYFGCFLLGLVLSLRYWFTLYAIGDRPTSARDAFRFSANVAHGHFREILVWILIALAPSMFLVSTGLFKYRVVTFLSGILVGPLLLLSGAAAYDDLLRSSGVGSSVAVDSA